MKIQAVVCDIEGTTSSISFVHRVLFPLSLERMHDYLRENAADRELKAQLAELWVRLFPGQPQSADMPEILERKLVEFIQNDVKDTTLKWVQGKIWKQAFESGVVKGHVYPEVAGFFERWISQGMSLYIYSSGSVEAQQLLFRHSQAGDLTRFLRGYFDTTTGPKRETDSYRSIAKSIGVEPASILFLSDITAELDAAQTAGFKTCLLLRGAAATPAGYTGPTAADFAGVHQQFFL
ncbi:acireductone synthase [Turneriella parva]|uniref:Enolase-phosphatase E1 n=1 Tax=Turneriella parva (strain ATCC BAA-1111 / DSM 21527 / NCTC 11395 / H) TaxID=869212 RepID=I4BC10_TURPD|nr:acireductone synthase [Turneriella parva]AFM14817.1 acireductone synthase [Turneriella parva DSM 21527]